MRLVGFATALAVGTITGAAWPSPSHALTGSACFRNGVVVFDPGAIPPPEGTRVSIESVERDEEVLDLSRRLLAIAGMVKGLPADLADQHDHYIHGTPRR